MIVVVALLWARWTWQRAVWPRVCLNCDIRVARFTGRRHRHHCWITA